MKIEGYIEISEEEYDRLSAEETALFDIGVNEKRHYFKKAQKFPICFEDDDREIKVEKGVLIIAAKEDNQVITFGYTESFPLLVKAVEKAKEVMKKNGN